MGKPDYYPDITAKLALCRFFNAQPPGVKAYLRFMASCNSIYILDDGSPGLVPEFYNFNITDWATWEETPRRITPRVLYDTPSPLVDDDGSKNVVDIVEKYINQWLEATRIDHAL